MYSSLLQTYIKVNQAAPNLYGWQTSANPYQTTTGSTNKIQNPQNYKPSYYMPSSTPVKIDTPEDIQKKSKKKTVAKIALLSAAALGVTLGAIAAFRHSGGIIESAKEFVGKITKKAPVSTHEFNQEGLLELQKGADNVNNAKDVVTRHILMKIPGYDKFDSFISDKYRKTGLKATTKGWAKAKKAFGKAQSKILSALDNATDFEEAKANRIKELLSKRNSVIEQISNPDGIQNRMTQVDRSMRRIDKEAWAKIKDLKTEGFKGLRKLSKEALAEDRINDAKKLQKSLLKPFRDMDLTQDEANELKTLLKELKEKSGANFMSDFIAGNWQYKRAKTKEAVDLFEKIRDINYGCGPSDVLGIAGTVGLLGVYTAQAETKEERVGVTLTTGIPLLTTVATTIFATNKMVAGAKAMVLGLITGFIANKIGSKVNEKYKEAHNIQEVPKTIVEINDYTDKIVGVGENIFNPSGRPFQSF